MTQNLGTCIRCDAKTLNHDRLDSGYVFFICEDCERVRNRSAIEELRTVLVDNKLPDETTFNHCEHEECHGCSLSMAHCDGCPTKHPEKF
jgi:hypothetical protein